MKGVFHYGIQESNTHQLTGLPHASRFRIRDRYYACNVTINFNGNNYNAKSLLNIIAACIKCGSEIELICDGPDENAALAEGVQMIESGLGEK